MNCNDCLPHIAALKACGTKENCKYQMNKPPTWYTEREMYDWLRSKSYSHDIAKELAKMIADNYQKAFIKGYEMGKGALNER
jgi:aromatic ring-opening dioxygenase catalytic subunit (LigB family)